MTFTRNRSIDHIVAVLPVPFQSFISVEFAFNRSLDRGNPHPAAIGSDFNRLGVDFWVEVYGQHIHNRRRRELLEELIIWRNAIAHQDFTAVSAGTAPALHLSQVRAWRRAVGALAESFDRVMYDYLLALLNRAPW